MTGDAKTLRGFRATLQDQINESDTSWTYNVVSFPDAKKTNAANLLKAITVSSSTTNQTIQLRLENAPSNRVTWAESLDRFILISFSDFRLQQNGPEDVPGATTKSLPARNSSNYVTRLLQTGLVLNGTRYHFFGHSNSQLKSRSCFLFADTKENIHTKIEAMGDFSKLKSAGKKAKRIGLLFSSAEVGMTIQPSRCEDIEDITQGDFNFTDGCGVISSSLARELARRKKILHRNERYLPSVFQIRYRGYKGVLTVEPTLQGKTLIKFRESMRKFKEARDVSLSIVGYSKPYAFGYLNDQIVLLLHALGVNTQVLLQKQDEHLRFLARVYVGEDSATTFQFLSYCDRADLAERLLMEGVQPVHSSVRKLVQQEYEKMISKRGEQKCRIMLLKSRLLYGICDPSDAMGHIPRLREGQCFVRITSSGDGIARSVVGTEVIVTRNPCLHPGDLQKFKAVDIPEFSHLQDCIVFPTRGRRPSADLMSGGDLDGDKFFVCWDPDIVPCKMSEPAEYPGVKEAASFAPITDDMRAEYFAQYNNASLGRVNKLFLSWARLKGPMSSECQQLNRLFSQCVDGKGIKVPQNLEDPPVSERTNFVLDLLHMASEKTIKKAVDMEQTSLAGFSLDTMDLLLSRDVMALSEFELIHLTMKWCREHHASLLDFANFFNFSALSDEQKAWILNVLPKEKDTPTLVRNGLLQSDLVLPEELLRFNLDDHRLHWKRIFSSSDSRMGRFLDTLCTTSELFYKKLIILRVDERLSIAIYLPAKIAKAQECVVDASVRVFALPRSEGSDSAHYRVVPTKKRFRLYCDSSAFQLYLEKRGATWIFLRSGAVDDSSYRNTKNEGDKRRQKQERFDDGTNFECRASINLGMISSAIQKHVGRVRQAGILGAEIYAITNRDLRSMRLLDQWLEHIDTEEVMPLYEREEKEYFIPTPSNLEWEKHPKHLIDLSNGCYDFLRSSCSVEDLREVLEFFSGLHAIKVLRDIFPRILGLLSDWTNLEDRTTVLQYMLDVVLENVSLTCLLLQSAAWNSNASSLQPCIDRLGCEILKRLILVSNELGLFVLTPLGAFLKAMTRITMQQMSDLAEIISLSVRSAEFALEVILEELGPHLERLLVGNPVAVKQFAKGLLGCALDHIDEAMEAKPSQTGTVHLSRAEKQNENFVIVMANLRIDLPSFARLRMGDHVRLTVVNPPANAPLARPYSMDGLVVKAEQGSAFFRCLQEPPSYLEDCSWDLQYCASFVTTKTMLDALTCFYTERESCCRLYGLLVPIAEHAAPFVADELAFKPDPSLNESQNEALKATVRCALTFLWGPPGTGKTHTIVIILKELLRQLPKKRILVTAPTHNAVDNILKKFISSNAIHDTGARPLRVSTALEKVSHDLKQFTCDAMAGKDLTADFKGQREAKKRVKESRLIFTTCTGAGLGLLRKETFSAVLIDEASQQPEPATLIPLVKGCERAVLVGDHKQLRPTVRKHALVQDFDMSLFERHYELAQDGVGRVRLNTQYRMHRDIAAFSSTEFYGGGLQTAVQDDARPLPPTAFAWPKKSIAPSAAFARNVFIQCSASEDLGHQSKSNKRQAEICKEVCHLLGSPPPSIANDVNAAGVPQAAQPLTIAILTPYSRQRQLLTQSIPKHETNSIDGFQGREADVVVFVTVRCNKHHDLGFLADMRRLNVAMTRAKAGVIIIGDRRTLTEGEDRQSKDIWARLLGGCTEVASDALAASY